MGFNDKDLPAWSYRNRLSEQDGYPVVLREFQQVISLIQGNQRMTQNELNRPFSILSVDWQGNFSTFDPELLSVASDRYGSFNLGNLKDLTLVESTHTDQFRRLMADMSSGVETCHKSCEYFGLWRRQRQQQVLGTRHLGLQ